MINSVNDDNHRFEIIQRFEHDDVNFQCDLMDVAWWKRPNLLATRFSVILPKFRSKVSLKLTNDNENLQILTIRELQSNDSGVYECETLGAIRQFNLIVMVRLTTVELGAQLISSHDSINDYISNQTDHNLLHQSLRSYNGSIYLREHQLIRLTCVVSRALPAAILHFPFDIDYHIERNSTIENDDNTYRTILVLILRINRYYHKRIFHCEATQSSNNNNETQYEQHRILSNILQMDIAYSPICSRKTTTLPEFLTGIRRPINITCHMNNGNPTKINFTWHLPNGHKRFGNYLNKTSNYITIKADNITDFGQITCRAQNELGLFGECHFNMVLGGVPDPIESCHYTYLNTTLTVNCMAGFHQGDEDFFCYMYKRQQDGIYSEHARLKGNCAFILPDLKPEFHHDFRVFTKNKFGENFDQSYSIRVGKLKPESFAEKTGIHWPFMVLFIIGACLASIVLVCCSCYRIRKAMNFKRKAEENFENLTYRNPSSHHSYHNTNGKDSLVHVKQNGNGITYPVRPYRSKDYLISGEPSELHRNNTPFKPICPPDDETPSNCRSTFKETDLDHMLDLSNERSDGTMSNTKTLLINRNRTVFTPYDSKNESNYDSNHFPVTMQRRSSFQAATKLNSLDFSTTPESFYFLDKQLIKSSQRNHCSAEREREHYREKRRDHSAYAKVDFKQQTSLVMENQMIKDENSTKDQNWSQMKSVNEYNREISKDDKNFILNNDDRYRDDGIFV
ncbi:unnamed protein product [Rotaria magnacalcarata]|uniref:Ig-like domain-containing protein n=4 Tax=Rotaria magnacalcarata TaxID=392030 RepID=A0A814FJG1_9BILA|nr:unnamed protein product [Rotaria magnacalcarata]CAF1640419.1 unnamed protein product [Rotaria magnacalcarata]CAF2237392.1 unnamed protein product [Rotaria magnacalcarata]